MIQKRALGPSFSTGERCRISSNFLPNKMHQVAKYSTKAFCGSYSKDGRFFLTASQGKFFFIFKVKLLLFIIVLIFYIIHQIFWQINFYVFTERMMEILYNSKLFLHEMWVGVF